MNTDIRNVGAGLEACATCNTTIIASCPQLAHSKKGKKGYHHFVKEVMVV
jgi:hypothetical protein